MTWGETLEAIRAYQERERQRAKDFALIAYQLAGLTAQAVLSGKLPPLYDVFPFWTESEISAFKLERLRHIMERHTTQRIEGDS